MKRINNKSKIKVISILIFGLLVLGFISTDVYAVTSYRSNLTKGTDELIVTHYDESTWNTTVGSSLTPNDFIQGDSHNVNAKSKITLKGWTQGTWQLYDWLVTLFFPMFYTSEEIFMLLGIMESQGYNETTINDDYITNYTLWYGLRSVWNFTIGEYDENPSYIDGIIILQNPIKYKIILEDYNNITGIFNGNFAIQMAGFTFPNFTADDFLWQFALKGFAIAEPYSVYLNEVVNELGCENVTISDSTLIFERYGLTNYTVEITYGVKGMMSSFLVKDSMESIILKINSSNSEWIFFLILIIASISAIGLAILIITRKRKR
ncbi:MAG: hypothetical protein EU552_02900 [Promethearchaeota archaeon]|nr:MAG: hypothetical protein EU552_02900 [Candidatus Lokiarchaeota archaeon]